MKRLRGRQNVHASDRCLLKTGTFQIKMPFAGTEYLFCLIQVACLMWVPTKTGLSMFYLACRSIDQGNK